MIVRLLSTEGDNIDGGGRTPTSPHISSIRVHTEIAPFGAECPIKVYTDGLKPARTSDPPCTHRHRACSDVSSAVHTEAPT